VAAEIVKQQLGAGRRREIYFFRDQQGLEVDFIVPAGTLDDLLAVLRAGEAERVARELARRWPGSRTRGRS
jgi:hypothetical protein